MSTHSDCEADDGTMTRWQHKLASRVVIQAFKDLRDRTGPADIRISAREFLAGSAMLRYWCHVGALDLYEIKRRAARFSDVSRQRGTQPG